MTKSLVKTDPQTALKKWPGPSRSLIQAILSTPKDPMSFPMTMKWDRVIGEGSTLSRIAKTDMAEARVILLILFQRLDDCFNLAPEKKLSQSQLAQLVNHFLCGPLSIYKVEDIIQFVNLAGTGTYGNPHRLDIPTVLELWGKYEDERTQKAVEIQQALHRDYASDPRERDTTKPRAYDAKIAIDLLNLKTPKPVQ